MFALSFFEVRVIKVSYLGSGEAPYSGMVNMETVKRLKRKCRLQILMILTSDSTFMAFRASVCVCVLGGGVNKTDGL